jgi:hypothetical protein
MDNPLKYFAELHDPRVERNREQLLEEVLLIAIAAVLSGTETWNDIADYGEAILSRRPWPKASKQNSCLANSIYARCMRSLAQNSQAQFCSGRERWNFHKEIFGAFTQFRST